VKYYGPKKFLAAAFVLTLALKWLLYHGEPAADPEALGKAVKSFLLQHGFESHLEKRFDQVLVYANAGKCRMLISEAAPQGWDHSSNEIWAKPIGRLSYIFEGAIHVHEPFLAPVIDEYWTRVRFKMGLSPSHHPVLAVAASDECTINALPWRELGTLSLNSRVITKARL
jgi:hypothetical protein